MSEVLEQPAYNPHLKKVLKTYRTNAMLSLSGPNSCLGTTSWPHKLTTSSGETDTDPTPGKNMNSCTVTTKQQQAILSSCPNTNVKKQTPGQGQGQGGDSSPGGGEEYDPFLAPPPFPIQQLPILTAPDQSRSERSETSLEGETISCFVVGGEKRLCLPQILNSVLRDFSLQQINAVCDELQIFCSRCNREQLEVLKVTGVLPFSAPSCGLITKTDAERLCAALLYRHLPMVPPGKTPGTSFKVYHECFGKCKGLYSPDHYTSPAALCIECLECHGHLSPQKFVCHAHRYLEKRTCHWGFDSANWRAYILLAQDQPDLERLQSHLDELKARYCDEYANKYKRKQYEQEEKDLSKKIKYAEESSPAAAASYLQYVCDPVLAYWYSANPWPRASAFRPWSPVIGKDGKPSPISHQIPHQQSAAFIRDSVPQSLPSFLSHGPPVLLNPERVVPSSETERFEPHYQPNVALAPPSAQQKTVTVSRAALKMIASTCESHVNGVGKIVDAPSMTLIGNPEMETTTDTDETLSDSTISAESNDHVPEVDLIHSPLLISDTVEDLVPFRRLLDANNVNGSVVEELLREVEKLRSKFVEKASVEIAAKKSLQQEVELLKISKKEKLREASESKRLLRKQLEQERVDHAAKMAAAVEAQKELRRELEALRNANKGSLEEKKAESAMSEKSQMRKKEGKGKKAKLESVLAASEPLPKSNEKTAEVKSVIEKVNIKVEVDDDVDDGRCEN